MRWRVLFSIALVSSDRAFITSQTYSGNLGGVGPANAKCQANAAGVYVPGEYIALASVGGQNPFDFLVTGLPIITYNGSGWVTAASSSVALRAFGPSIGFQWDQFGNVVSQPFWTGFLPQSGVEDANNNCNKFTTSASLTSSAGGPGATGSNWCRVSTGRGCQAPAALLCVELVAPTSSPSPAPTSNPTPSPTLPNTTCLVSEFFVGGSGCALEGNSSFSAADGMVLSVEGQLHRLNTTTLRLGQVVVVLGTPSGVGSGSNATVQCLVTLTRANSQGACSTPTVSSRCFGVPTRRAVDIGFTVLFGGRASEGLSPHESLNCASSTGANCSVVINGGISTCACRRSGTASATYVPNFNQDALLDMARVNKMATLRKFPVPLIVLLVSFGLFFLFGLLAIERDGREIDTASAEDSNNKKNIDSNHNNKHNTLLEAWRARYFALNYWFSVTSRASGTTPNSKRRWVFLVTKTYVNIACNGMFFGANWRLETKVAAGFLSIFLGFIIPAPIIVALTWTARRERDTKPLAESTSKRNRRVVIAAGVLAIGLWVTCWILVILLGLSFDSRADACINNPQPCYCSLFDLTKSNSLYWLASCVLSLLVDVIFVTPFLAFILTLWDRFRSRSTTMSDRHKPQNGTEMAMK